VVDGSDNFHTRYLVNDVCVATNKPLVFGAILNFQGQLSVFNHQNGPNYRDLFPEAAEPDVSPSCAEAGVIGVLPGMIGTFMANEAIKIICGIGEVLSGRLLTVDALTLSIQIFNYATYTKAFDLLTSAKHDLKNRRDKQPQKIEEDELGKWIEEAPEKLCMIDVRETYEYEEQNSGRVNIPLYELTDRLDQLPSDKVIIFCCHSGYRSRQAAILFASLKQRACYYLKGDILNCIKNENL